MFLIKAGTAIKIQAPKSMTHFNWGSEWISYTTKEDKLYDKEEVWDAVGVHNGREDIPAWAERNITEHGYTVIKRDDKYAMVPRSKMYYLD